MTPDQERNRQKTGLKDFVNPPQSEEPARLTLAEAVGTAPKPLTVTAVQELTEEHTLTPPEAEVLRIVLHNDSAADLAEGIYQLRLLAKLRYGATLALMTLLLPCCETIPGLAAGLSYDAVSKKWSGNMTYVPAEAPRINPTK